MELLQYLCWDDGGISWLGGGGVGIWTPLVVTIGNSVGLVRRADAFLDVVGDQRGRDGCWFAFWWDEIVGDILDKQAFPLEIEVSADHWKL